MNYSMKKLQKRIAKRSLFCMLVAFILLTQNTYSQESDFMKDWPMTQEILDAYSHGQQAVVNNDYKLAAYYFSIAAEQGFPPAQCDLGQLYANGKAGEFDLKKAFKWTKLSAEAKWPIAFTPLVYMYYEGLGTEKDIEKALNWYYKGATEAKNPEAQYCLGIAFENGESVRQDYLEASKWYKNAALQGHAAAANNLAHLYLSGKLKAITKEDGMYWLIKAADWGNMLAQYTLGLRYIEGAGVAQNHHKGMEYLKRSAAQGYLQAQIAIAEIEAKQ